MACGCRAYLSVTQRPRGIIKRRGSGAREHLARFGNVTCAPSDYRIPMVRGPPTRVGQGVADPGRLGEAGREISEIASPGPEPRRCQSNARPSADRGPRVGAVLGYDDGAQYTIALPSTVTVFEGLANQTSHVDALGRQENTALGGANGSITLK